MKKRQKFYFIFEIKKKVDNKNVLNKIKNIIDNDLNLNGKKIKFYSSRVVF